MSPSGTALKGKDPEVFNFDQLPITLARSIMDKSTDDEIFESEEITQSKSSKNNPAYSVVPIDIQQEVIMDSAEGIIEEIDENNVKIMLDVKEKIRVFNFSLHTLLKKGLPRNLKEKDRIKFLAIEKNGELTGRFELLESSKALKEIEGFVPDKEDLLTTEELKKFCDEI